MIRLSYCTLFLPLFFALGLAGQKTVQKKLTTELASLIEQSEVFQRGFTGFALYDPEAAVFPYAYQADKYFTPASNAKILTYYAAETLLRGEWPVVHYQEQGDTLLIWGTGYPLLLHPDFIGYDTLNNWLRERKENTWLLANGHFYDKRYGEGWSWDDYPYGYQMEKAALPIYGNAVHFSKTGHLAPIQVMPERFKEYLIYKKTPTLGRYEDRNIFTFGDRALKAQKLDRSIGFIYETSLVETLFRDTFGRQVYFIPDTLPRAIFRKTLSAPIPDTVYQLFLQDSDNFLSEQLLQVASAQRYGYISSNRILAYVRDTMLRNLPQPLDWVDGSGLSRYNQFTPMSVVMVLDQLYQQVSEERLFRLFPAGGQSGTISNWYKGPDDTPFVFAKTGTLRHIHCLSGYMKTKTGKTFIFSFMHNNYPGKISELKDEMEVVLLWLYEHLE